MIQSISYGKRNVTLYRSYATPLKVQTIPESPFTGSSNVLFAVDVDLMVLGDHFIPAYTEGDNRQVIATDSMKNFILNKGLTYKGATLEGFLYFLGCEFMTTYDDINHLVVAGSQQPFDAMPVPTGDGFAGSNVLFSRSHNDFGYAELELRKDGDSIQVTDHSCGRLELQLIKVTGSSFASFVRDDYTTLPEYTDRPLFIYLDMMWQYSDADSITNDDLTSYIASEQMRDLAGTVFHEFNSRSIQHLVYEMGTRMLARFPQLAAVSFDAQNRLWDTAFTSKDDDKVKAYCDPRPPYGNITLTMTQDSTKDLTQGE
jgi:urate oxidase